MTDTDAEITDLRNKLLREERAVLELCGACETWRRRYEKLQSARLWDFLIIVALLLAVIWLATR